MTDLFGNHIAGFPMRWLNSCKRVCVSCMNAPLNLGFIFSNSFGVAWLAFCLIAALNDEAVSLLHHKDTFK